MEQCLILSADKWEMPDERTGELRSGVSVWFLNDYREDTDTSVGYKPSKLSAPVELLDQLKGQVPGYFEMIYGSRPGAQGKAQLTLVGVKPVRSSALFRSGKAATPSAQAAG